MIYPPAGELVRIIIPKNGKAHHSTVAEWSPFFRCWMGGENLHPIPDDVIAWEPLSAEQQGAA